MSSIKDVVLTNESVKEFSEVPVTKARERRINTLNKKLNVKTYLEVGVQKGLTFFKIQAAVKTAVDPKFLFDVGAASDPAIQFCEVESDIFFATLAVAVKYDFIYLDGLHRFEQTYRDFCNSIEHSHDRTVILIDDTKPNDVYSAIPDQAICNRFRKRANVTHTNAWHGDVYKTIFAIHDFHPGFNYRTIVGSGNSQTLIWRSKAGWRKPLYNSLETISRLSYFEMINHIEVLRQSSEEDAIALCLSEILPSS